MWNSSWKSNWISAGFPVESSWNPAQSRWNPSGIQVEIEKSSWIFLIGLLVEKTCLEKTVIKIY